MKEFKFKIADEFYMNVIQKNKVVDVIYEDVHGYRRVIFETDNEDEFAIDVYFDKNSNVCDILLTSGAETLPPSSRFLKQVFRVAECLYALPPTKQETIH